MALLIKNVKGVILDNIECDVINIKKIEGNFGYSDWFKVGNLEVFLQNFKNISNTEYINTPTNNGLTFNKSVDFTQIEISY